MSSRSVSALPTCLQGRLTLRQTWSVSGVARCRRRQYSFVQAAVAKPEGDSSHTELRSISAASQDTLQDSSKRGKKARSHNVSQIQDFISNPTATARTSKEGYASASRPAIRIGKVLETPNFIRDGRGIPDWAEEAAMDEGTKHKVQDRRIEHIEVRNQEWETLYDKFIEVRRTNPTGMLDAFSEQRAIARRFLGDTTRGEVSTLEFRCKWLALSKKEKSKLLPALLVGSLVESAMQTLFVLSSVGSIQQCFRIRMNCMRDISFMYSKELQQSPKLKRVYEGLVERLRSPDSWPKDKLPTVLLQNLLFWSTPEQCQAIIRNFFERYPNAEVTSVVAIIDHYLRIEDSEQAFEYIKRLPQSMLRQPNTIVKRFSHKLLKLDVVARSETGTNFKYLPQLLALGIPPDEQVHNIVIQSAISNEMPDVAWDLYQYLRGSKFQVNARSHLVLLRDFFQRGDYQRVNEIMTAIHNREDLIGDQYLVAYSMNIVRNISCYEKQLEPAAARSHVMALYDRAYNRAPLVRLGIVRATEGSAKLPDPSPTLLAFTIWTCILTHRRDGDVLRLWEWVKYLITNGDQAITDAARHDIIYNGLMLFHARKATTLFQALEVMQYMLSNTMCQPTSRTWSIMLCGFLKHGQSDQAEKILAMMRSRGYSVQEVNERYSSYFPPGYDLQAMAEKVSQSLDEKDMPEGIEDLLAGSASLQGEASSDDLGKNTNSPSSTSSTSTSITD